MGRKSTTQGRHTLVECHGVAIRWAALLAAGGLLLTLAWLTPQAAFWGAGGLIMYTYLGYPVLCLLLSQLFYNPWRQASAEPPSLRTKRS